MDTELRKLLQALHDAPPLAALVLAGGGTGAVAQLLAVPGASRTVLEVVVPYQQNVFCEYLGYRPTHFCSADTAAALAERALERARHQAPGTPVLGVSCTASLVTDRPKRGDHRFFIGTATEWATTVTWAVLQKGARDREEEEAVVDAALLNELAREFKVPRRVPVGLRPGEQLQTETKPTNSLLSALQERQVACICVEPDGQMSTGKDRPYLVLPGAFNPLHEGHIQLAQTAARLAGAEPAFELSIINVDKPPLTIEEVRRRIDQFHWLAPLWLTRAALFTEKATLFPGAVFVVGVDTAARIVDPRYYGNLPEQMAAALEHIRSRRCGFLVAGRKDPSGRFKQLADLTLPPAFQDLFLAIPESEFRYDLSSTELRTQERLQL